MEGRFYCCVKSGHKYPYFRTKDKITKYEWAIKKAQQHVQSNNDGDEITSISSLLIKKEYPVIGWSGLHCSFAQAVNMK